VAFFYVGEGHLSTFSFDASRVESTTRTLYIYVVMVFQEASPKDGRIGGSYQGVHVRGFILGAHIRGLKLGGSY